MTRNRLGLLSSNDEYYGQITRKHPNAFLTLYLVFAICIRNPDLIWDSYLGQAQSCQMKQNENMNTWNYTWTQFSQFSILDQKFIATASCLLLKPTLPKRCKNCTTNHQGGYRYTLPPSKKSSAILKEQLKYFHKSIHIIICLYLNSGLSKSYYYPFIIKA